jgi:hypothetical protein
VIVVVPTELPETTPDPVPMVATVVLLLLQVPEPTLELVNPDVNPSQVYAKPAIGTGNGYTKAILV